MKSVPLPRIGMRVVKTAVAVMLSYTIFVPFGLIYNEALGGVWGQLGPLYACIACIICTQSTLGPRPRGRMASDHFLLFSSSSTTL